MKRFFSCFLLYTVFTAVLFAQTVEKALTLSIDSEFPVYENTNPYEGSDSGMSSLIVDGNDYYFINGISGDWYLWRNGNRPKTVLSKEGYSYAYPFKVYLPNGFVFGYFKNRESSDTMQLFFKINDKEYFYEGSAIPKLVDQVYETNNTLFIQTDDKQMVSIEFSENGTFTVRNAEETIIWLEGTKGEELGWSQIKNSNGKVKYNCFGDINMNQVSTAYSVGVLTNLTMKSPKYAGFTKISELKG